MIKKIPNRRYAWKLGAIFTVLASGWPAITFAQGLSITTNTWMADKPVEPPWMQHALEMQAGVKPGEAMDEPMGAKSLQGTSVTPRVPACFPAEGRDLFWQMDMVPDSTTNKTLHPLNFDIKIGRAHV